MTKQQTEKYRGILKALADRAAGTAAGIEEQVRVPTGGQAAGGLSNAPMHLADVGTDVYDQELAATLLEGETHILGEITDAIDRLDQGTFGRCENCDAAIPEGRLDAIPYARHCVPCATKLTAGQRANINDGRPGSRSGADPLGPGDRSDVHAAGTPGGGTAVGGLAGTNTGDGSPDEDELEAAMGSGKFDAELEGGDPDDTAYAGPGGGAVGGTPAGKRATGGKSRRPAQ